MTLFFRRVHWQHKAVGQRYKSTESTPSQSDHDLRSKNKSESRPGSSVTHFDTILSNFIQCLFSPVACGLKHYPDFVSKLDREPFSVTRNGSEEINGRSAYAQLGSTCGEHAPLSLTRLALLLCLRFAATDHSVGLSSALFVSPERIRTGMNVDRCKSDVRKIRFIENFPYIMTKYGIASESLVVLAT